MPDVFEPEARPRGERAGERGWIKEGSAPGAGDPSVALRFKANPSAPERALMEFHITKCADETKPVPSLPLYADAPGGSFVFDARYLVESSPAGDREGARANLRAVTEAYEWWKAHKRTDRVVFFCVSGQNRSVASSLVFALSLIWESEMAPPRRREARDPPWSIAAVTPGFDEPLEFDGARETLVHYLLRLVHEIRPRAFFKKGGKPWTAELVDEIAALVPRARATRGLVESIGDAVEEVTEPVVDYARLWVGHADNRSILWVLDAAVRSRLYADWWLGESWLGRGLPPTLAAARPELERKRKGLATGKIEAEDSLDSITPL